ncbi:hypothetical protein FB451DRAFT_367085 [Mycena latifolia]|nr:hypothetical protein FB451DRAFT_367085 [Mycena latifolia]
MHRGLMIPEIVRNIVEEVELPPESMKRLDLRALAAFARTCTTFLEPALDLLWSDQPTVANLLATFPDDLIRQVKDEWNRPSDVLLLRPVSPKDWERPLFYSRRVKWLFLNQTMLVVSTKAFEAISLSCPGDHMFPNLQTLVLNLTPRTYESQFATSIDFLISPQLTEIRLDFGTGFRLLCQIVPTLAVKCPSLTCVGISMDESYDAATLQVVSDFVRSLARIQDLAVTNLDQDAFKHLGGLTSLKVLRLGNPKVPWMPALPIDSPTSSHHMYSSLTALHFNCTTVERVITFIKAMSNAPLKELESHPFSDAATSVEIGRLYSALAAHYSHTSLQRISIEGGWAPEEGVPDQYRISGAILRTLFCFVNMVSVSLDQPFGFDLDDADIFDIAHAWPQLEYLSLTGHSDLKPRVTVQGLYAFGQQCPNLDYLEIAVDATVVLAEPPGRSVLQHSLQMLEVLYSPIRTPKAVVAFLASIFPEVDVNFYRDDEVDPASEEAKYWDRWEEVKQSLKDLRGQKIQDNGGIEKN